LTGAASSDAHPWSGRAASLRTAIVDFQGGRDEHAGYGPFISRPVAVYLATEHHSGDRPLPVFPYHALAERLAILAMDEFGDKLDTTGRPDYAIWTSTQQNPTFQSDLHCFTVVIRESTLEAWGREIESEPTLLYVGPATQVLPEELVDAFRQFRSDLQ